MIASRAKQAWSVALLLIVLFGFTGIAPAEQNTLTSKELDEGWILLFDGRTLFGWAPASKANWEAADGTIRVSEGEPGLLCTTSQFADYVLKVDFRSPKGTNSGVFLRTNAAPEPADVTATCYELNIADGDNPYPTGSFVQRKRCEGIHESAGWQTFEVTAEGSTAGRSSTTPTPDPSAAA
jgi:hypothetical protein